MTVAPTPSATTRAVDRLTALRIHVDRFRVGMSHVDTYILTHRHSDHYAVPAAFGGVALAALLPGDPPGPDPDEPRIVRCLEPGRWYHTATFGVAFRVVNTTHSPDSIGIYVPEASVLYMGDSRLLPDLAELLREQLPDPRSCGGVRTTVVYDDLFERAATEARARHGPESWVVRGATPSTEHACRTLRDAVVQLPVLRCLHYGILSALAECGACRRVTLDPTLTEYSRQLLHNMPGVEVAPSGAATRPGDVRVVGRAYRGPSVVPSTMFFIHNDANPAEPADDGPYVRVFHTAHATIPEIDHWRQALRGVCDFEALGGRPIWSHRRPRR